MVFTVNRASGLCAAYCAIYIYIYIWHPGPVFYLNSYYAPGTAPYIYIYIYIYIYSVPELFGGPKTKARVR